TAAAVAQPSCAEAVAATLGTIATRIYHQAATGRNVGQAVHRVTSSTALIAVLRGGRVLASAGSGAAVAPVSGALPGAGGARYLLSVQSDRTYTQVTSQVTGAEVLLL